MTEQEESGPDRRSRKRRQVALWASVSWTDHGPRVRCVIRDATEKSCRIVTSRADEFPDDVTLAVDGVAKPITARIVWRSENAAGVEFA